MRDIDVQKVPIKLWVHILSKERLDVAPGPASFKQKTS